jgi:hypothetical protein
MSKTKSKFTVRWVIITGLVLAAGCLDNDEAPPLPSCTEIGAPTTLLCTRDGRCSFDGMACQRDSGSGSGSGSAAIDGGQ